MSLLRPHPLVGQNPHDLEDVLDCLLRFAAPRKSPPPVLLDESDQPRAYLYPVPPALELPAYHCSWYVQTPRRLKRFQNRQWSSPIPPLVVLYVCEIYRDDKAMLAKLALVHRDWCSIVRAFQFLDVTIDFSERSIALLDRLVAEESFLRFPDEALEEAARDPRSLIWRPRIGPLIKTLRVHPSFEAVAAGFGRKAGEMTVNLIKNRPADGDMLNFSCYKDRGINILTVAEQVKHYDYLPNYRHVMLEVVARCVPNLRAFEMSDPLCFEQFDARLLHKVLLRHRALRHVHLENTACHFPQDPNWPEQLREDIGWNDKPLLLYNEEDDGDGTPHQDDLEDGIDYDEIDDDYDEDDPNYRPMYYTRNRGSLETLAFDLTACGRSAAASLLFLMTPSQDTLEGLRIVPGRKTMSFNDTVAFGEDRLTFRLSQLIYLNLSEACYLSRDPRTFDVSCFDASAWSKLLVPTLIRLSFPDTRDQGFRKALAATHHLPQLTTVIAQSGIQHSPSGAAWRAPHDFFDRHAGQLEEVQLGATSLAYATRIFLFAAGWSKLAKLNLAIQAPGFDVPALGDASPPSVTIPADLIMALGQLPALETLHLAVGCGDKWNHQWKPDHALFRSFLGRLTKLRHLVFTLDTYDCLPAATRSGLNPRDFGRVYEHLEDLVAKKGYLNPDKFDGTNMAKPPVWCRAACVGAPEDNDDALRHAHKMGNVAYKYALILPNLEWVFCGGWSMGIARQQYPGGVTKPSVYFVESKPVDVWELRRRRRVGWEQL